MKGQTRRTYFDKHTQCTSRGQFLRY